MTDWARRGACRDKPNEWWFPGRGEDVRKAVSVCTSCPVRVECLEYALRTKQPYGIWGGVDMLRPWKKTPVGETWDLTCVRCEVPFRAPAVSGSQPELCDECRIANRRESSRRRNVRYRGGPQTAQA